MSKWWMILAAQIWHLPFLALYILGLIFALSRRDMGKASRFAALGFGLMALGVLISSASSYLMFSMREEGGLAMAQIAKTIALIGFFTMAVNLGGFGLIMTALFMKRPPPSPV